MVMDKNPGTLACHSKIAGMYGWRRCLELPLSLLSQPASCPARSGGGEGWVFSVGPGFYSK